MIIRNAEIADLEKVLQITSDTISEIYSHYYAKGVVDFFLKHHSRENILSDIEKGIVWLLEMDGCAAGTVTIRENAVNRLFVLPEYQSSGFGSRLMDFAEAEIAKQYSQIHIDSSLPAKEIGDDVEGDSDDYTSLFGVYTLEEETGLFPEKIRKRVSNIKKIHIPSTVREITYNCFNYIQDGKSINIPKEVEENVEHLAINIKWSKFKISKKNYKYKVENGCLVSQDGGYLYGLINKTKRIKKLVIPETVKIIPVFMQTWDVDEIYMPAGMKEMALYGPTTKKPVRVKIGKGSKTYAIKEGSIYNRITGRLVSGYVKDGVLKIPSKITSVGNNGYLGPKPSKIIIPSSVREINQLLGMTDSKNFVCVCKGKKPPKLVDEDGSETVKNMTIYVPQNCKKIYEKKWKSEWKYASGLKVSIIEQ